MSNSTKITFKRSNINLQNDENRTLDFGEPLLIDTQRLDEDGVTVLPGGEDYLVIGANINGSSKIKESIFFRGMTLQQAKYQVTYIGDVNCPGYNDNQDNLNVITDLQGNYLKVKMVATTEKDSIDDSDSNKYHIVCKSPNGMLTTFDLDDAGIYIDGRGVMHGAAWNDYAENRHFEGAENIEDLVGHVVCEDGKGNLVLSTERLQPCSYIVSDTYGMTIGEGNIHVAVAGKVSVIVEEPVELGDCITAGANGKASKMSRQEIVNYPDRILGIVTKVSDEDEKVWVEIK